MFKMGKYKEAPGETHRLEVGIIDEQSRKLTIETSVKPESLASHSLHNPDQSFTIEFSGRQVYELLELLEKRALEETSYLRVRQAVAFAEAIRQKVQGQGF
jgi:hypothetical protein